MDGPTPHDWAALAAAIPDPAKLGWALPVGRVPSCAAAGCVKRLSIIIDSVARVEVRAYGAADYPAVLYFGHRPVKSTSGRNPVDNISRFWLF
jgi:hypothetical protein